MRSPRTTAFGARRAARRPAGSGRQFAAALAATGRQDGAAGAGAHPKPEPVGLRPTAVVRLEGPLAHGLAPSQSEPRRRCARPAGSCTVFESTLVDSAQAAPPGGRHGSTINGTDRPGRRSNRPGRSQVRQPFERTASRLTGRGTDEFIPGCGQGSRATRRATAKKLQSGTSAPLWRRPARC